MTHYKSDMALKLKKLDIGFAELESALRKIKNFLGATAQDAGAEGLVPPPAAGEQDKFLRGDGTWSDLPLSEATPTAAGLLSAADKQKLDAALTSTEANAKFVEQIPGKGLSTNDLTDDLLSRLRSAATAAGLDDLARQVSALQALIDVDSDAAINKFNEIVRFLSGIDSSEGTTLQSLLADIASRLSDKASRFELSNVLAEEPLTPGNFPAIQTHTREELKKDLFVDMWNEACGADGKYDPDNAPDAQHTFLLNRLWLTYEEAIPVLRYGQLNTSISTAAFRSAQIRTNLPARSSGSRPSGTQTFYSCSAEVLSTGDLAVSHLTFAECRLLHTIIANVGINITSNAPNAFSHCFALRTVTFAIRGNYNLFVEDSPDLSLASVQSIVAKSENTAPITITVHPDVYAKLTDVANAEWNALVAQAAAKQITFVTN